MSWTHGTILMQDGTLYPVCLPAMPPEAQAFSVNLVCPSGCVHTVAIEGTFLAAMETAAARLEAPPMPGALILGALWGPGDDWQTARATLDASYRGRVH